MHSDATRRLGPFRAIKTISPLDKYSKPILRIQELDGNPQRHLLTTVGLRNSYVGQAHARSTSLSGRDVWRPLRHTVLLYRWGRRQTGEWTVGRYPYLSTTYLLERSLYRYGS
jgi:hypothetical protein